MTLTEFLTARLDEDEERAGSGWSHDGDGRWERTDEGQSILTPRAVLAEVEAKRRIVNDYLACLGTNPGTSVAGHPVATAATLPVLEVAASTVQRGAAIAFERVLRDLALPYADHPDCDPGWKP